MGSRNAGLIADPLFVGATRPPMRWGVTYSALLFNLVFTMEVFLVTKNLLTLLICLPIHGVCALLCARDARFFDLLLLWGRTRLPAALGNLVPVPGCTPARTGSTAAWQLAMALHELGLARGVWAGLARRYPVRKSATAALGERPTVRQHYESLSVSNVPPSFVERIVLVDDVISRGRTLLAAATRLRCKFPHADVRAFALVRTTGFLIKIDRLLAPCEGIVYWARGDVQREP